MTTHISQTDPKALSTEEILAEIASFQGLAVAVLERWAALLKELAERRVPHPMFRHPVLQFWKSIAEKSLHPKAAVLLADRARGDMIRAVLPLSPEDQVRIAEGDPVPVARLTDAGEIRSDDVPIHRMDPATLKRAFGPDGLRTVYEQAEIIREAGKVVRIGAVTVIEAEQVLKIGNQKIRPEDLAAPLARLGYTLDLTRNAPDRPDVARLTKIG